MARSLAGWTGLASALAFGVLTLSVYGAHWQPLRADTALLDWSTAHRPELALAVARTLTWTGTGLVPYLLAVAAGLLAGRTTRRRLQSVAAALLCLAMVQLLRLGVMQLCARDRPPVEDWASHATRHAFPSGHATTSALVTGLLILAVLLRDPPRKRLLILPIAVWGLTVGLTRGYLGVHWFTDVLGGWLFATAALGLVTWFALTWLSSRTSPPVRPGSG